MLLTVTDASLLFLLGLFTGLALGLLININKGDNNAS